MNYPYPIIAREGWPFLAAAVIASLVVTVIAPWYCSLPLWLASLFILQFFRDPPRKIPGDDRTVVSPADGRIVAVERTQDPYLQRDALKVSVFMNVFDVHSNRSPVAGVVEKDWYHPGKYLNAALSKASGENERKALWIKTVNGFDVVCVQIAGLIARRILCYVHSGDRLARGQRYGFIRFGSRVDVYLPPDVLVKTSIGDKVYAAESVLAELPKR
ncbi:MAG TPA: phosphatidylserine decarboxylase [Burkholderiales bacterium]|nr:phosphatidylserine decarboxylase [Burkholderiales bacterium]